MPRSVCIPVQMSAIFVIHWSDNIVTMSFNSCHVIFLYPTLLPNIYPVKLLHSSCKHVFSIKVENSVDPDQLASDEAS